MGKRGAADIVLWSESAPKAGVAARPPLGGAQPGQVGAAVPTSGKRAPGAAERPPLPAKAVRLILHPATSAGLRRPIPIRCWHIQFYFASEVIPQPAVASVLRRAGMGNQQEGALNEPVGARPGFAVSQNS